MKGTLLKNKSKLYWGQIDPKEWLRVKYIVSPPRVKTEECKDHRLYRATPSGRDTVKGYKYRFLFILFLTACFTSVLVCITNSYYV